MKKSIIIILSIIITFIFLKSIFENPTFKGFYQSEANGYHIQMLIREKDNSFVEWIDNREVDRGTFEKFDTCSYRIKSSKQNFEITLNDDNSFEMIIKKLNNGNSIKMKNVSEDDTPFSFENGFDDIDEYKSLLD